MDVIEGAARGGKKRKPNFREDEILCLIEGIANEKVVIMTKLQSSLTNKKKKEVWREITAKVNAFGVALRTEDDIKKKAIKKRREADHQTDRLHTLISS